MWQGMGVSEEIAALTGGAGVRRLRDRLVLELSGEDAFEWLQGQVTSDVRPLEDGGAVYALFTSVKGKILADAWLLSVDLDAASQTIRVDAPASSRDALLESFDKYIVMEEVDVAVRDDLSMIAVQGPDAPTVTGRLEPAKGAAWPCDRLGTGGSDLVVASDAADAIVAELAGSGAIEVSEEAWEIVRLRGAVPRFGADFGEKNYPQEAGLRRRALSFDKGCYVGQEVVCTLESRGRLSKRLTTLELTEPRDPGTPLVTPEGREVGRVTSAARDDGVVRALGYVKAAAWEPGTELEAGGATARVGPPVE